MTKDINKKIIDKINDSSYEEEIKDFLKKLLVLELDHFEEGRWIYHSKYDGEIIKSANKFRRVEDEI